MEERLKILFVDDEADIRAVVDIALRRDPAIELRMAGSAREAQAILSAGGWRPDLLLVDMLMPDMTGTDLMVALRADKSTADIPILFMTASAWATGVDQYLKAGAIGVISKPFEPLTLPALIRAHWQRALPD